MIRRIAALLVVAAPLGAQQLPGYASASAAAERTLEAHAITLPTPASAEAHSKALSSEIHVSGTPAQVRTLDYVIDQFKKWGLETEVRSYDVWMPIPTAVHLWRVDGKARELSLAEPAVNGDPTSALPQYPTVNGYSGVGDVSGDVVYVNYGLIEDYARLDSLGVSVKGKIAIARYGRSFRGIKAREAEKHGAAALIIYSDPQDDGYVRGDVYPAGPMRSSSGVQRGSVLNVDGDPSTPGWPSTAGAKRLPLDRMDVPHIPVIAISYGNAGELLRDLKGAAIPQQSWQGGLPFRYHVGPGPVRARIVVRDDRATHGYKKIYDGFGIVRGSEFPNEMILIGGHRDAWGPGTADNISGTVSVLEAAHAIADEVEAGHRPKRTIVFASWDAEEWGLIGSTEYVEDDSLRLSREAVAYLNQDVAAQGVQFGGGGSPSLRSTLRAVAAEVPDPSGQGSVYDVWRKATHTAPGQEPAMDDPGGGSDFAGFYNHLGIPIADWGFGGPGGVYHSQYDDLAWMSKFGDPGFRYHAAAGRIGAAMTLRLADADVLPYDYVEFARTMQKYLPATDSALAARHWTATMAPVAEALTRFEGAALAFDSARDALVAETPSPDALARTNASLLGVERALTRPQGLDGRPWFRNLIYVADEDNGYANMVFPSVNEAIRAGDAERATHEIADLAAHFDAATAALNAARTSATGH
ncbi:MAG: M20/M25/M40 family metallo-hydrolase [Gemmatimonadota bacterium]|nr:M20/M25/M40 family metallo-hydrolase [Gemmatimonadota bacterium]MDE3173912.1 M20/M25/M40 family metallo-hydrolase [Gemmatimonadota bacterium]MDE3214747.1 M20/M25/M40 family metallo-hydrolase [Gemmatimonadota bacterium]